MGLRQVEFDLYLPLTNEDGSCADASIMHGIKKSLVERYGGVTDFRHKNEGLWKVNGVTFRDEILILRVLADGSAESVTFFEALKTRLEKDLNQEKILVVMRNVIVL